MRGYCSVGVLWRHCEPAIFAAAMTAWVRLSTPSFCRIAYELGVSEATIKAHVSAILQKLGVESRTQAVIAAAKIAGSQWRQGTPSEQ